MTWWRDKDRYEIFFNRDELKTRSRALPPEIRQTDQGVRYLAPTDPDAGGTWMLVNEFGLTVCLLNRWHDEAKVGAAGQNEIKHQSRGILVLGFAGAKTAAEVIAQLRDTDSRVYKPFTLVVADANELLVEVWDGERMFPEVAEAPLTSSSYCFPEVSQARTEGYQALPDTDPATLRIYQAGGVAVEGGGMNKESKLSAYTVRMNRPDAQTWSRSHLMVSSERIRWQYVEEMPNLERDSIEHNIELVGQV